MPRIAPHCVATCIGSNAPLTLLRSATLRPLGQRAERAARRVERRISLPIIASVCQRPNASRAVQLPQPRNFPDVRLPRSAAMHLDGDNRSASFTAGLSVSIREFFSRLTQFFVSSGGLWSKLDFDCFAQLLRTCRDGFGFSDAVET